jgi:hypothetical protein
MTNTLFPGRPGYTGPTTGWFGLLHHEILFERSHDVMERVAYVTTKKPKREIETRLHNMIWLDPEACPAILQRAPLYADYEAQCDSLDADYNAKRAPLNADYNAQRDALYADYNAKRAPLNAAVWVYIKTRIPDCAWNGRRLKFNQINRSIK